MSTKTVEPSIKRKWTREELLTDQLVPPAWVGARSLVPVAVGVAAAGLAASIVIPLFGGSLPAVPAVAAVGVWAGAALFWLGKGTHGGLVIFLAVALLPAVGAALVGAVWLVAVVVAATAAAVWTVRAELRRRNRISRALVLLNDGLGEAVEDASAPAETVMKPRWIVADSRTGLPVRWRRPTGLHDVDRNLLRLAHVAAKHTGVPVRLTMTAKWVTITELPAGETMEPLEAPVDAETRRVIETLSPAVGGPVVVHELSYDETNAFQRLVIGWSHDRSSRMAMRGVRITVLRTVKATLKFNRVTGESLEGKQITASWDAAHDRVVITPLKPMPDKIDHPAIEDPASPIVRFGVTRTGATCTWDLNSTAAHVMIGGVTGGGKTNLFLSLLSELPVDTEVRSIDPKWTSLKGIEFLPQAQGRKAAKTAVDMANQLEDVFEEMMRRVEGIDDDTIHPRDLHHLVLVVDEGAAMIDFLNDSWRDPEVREAYAARRGWEERSTPKGSTHPVTLRIPRIVQLGREALVHLLLASQRFDATWLGTDSRDQFAVRIGMGNMSAIASKMLFDDPHAAVAGLEPGPGRAWVQLGVGQAVEQAQIYYTPKLNRNNSTPEDRAILAGLGITLPEPLTHAAEPDVDEALVEDQPHLHVVPAPLEETAVVEDTLLPDAADVPVADLYEGAQILVETDQGETAVAVVDAITPDPADDDNLTVSWLVEETGEIGALSLPDDATLPSVAA